MGPGALLEGHAVVAYRDALYVFGGRDAVSGMMHNAVWRIAVADVAAAAGTDDGSVVAAHVPCTGHVPSPRCYAAVAQRGAFMLVTGGATADGAGDAQRRYPSHAARGGDLRPELSGDLALYALHLDTGVWSLYYVPPPGGSPDPAPVPRCHAALVNTGDGVVLFGGFPVAGGDAEDAKAGPAGQGGVPEDDGLPAPGLGGVFHVADGGTVARFPCDGDAPRLWGHSAVFAHGSLFAFGGVDTVAAAEVNALCVFGVQKRRWRWADFAVAPEPRALHTAVLEGARMIVFGGFSGASGRQAFPHLGDTWAFSLNTGTWQELQTAGDVPLPRSGHAAAAADGHMYVVGGLEGNAATLPAHGTVAVLNIARLRWATARLHVEPPPRPRPAAVPASDPAPEPPQAVSVARSQSLQAPTPLQAALSSTPSMALPDREQSPGDGRWSRAQSQTFAPAEPDPAPMGVVPALLAQPTPALAPAPAQAPEPLAPPRTRTTVAEWRARQQPGADRTSGAGAAPLEVPPAPRTAAAKDVHVESVLSIVRHVREAEQAAAVRSIDERLSTDAWRSQQLAEAAATAERRTAEMALAARGLSTASGLQQAMAEQRRLLDDPFDAPTPGAVAVPSAHSARPPPPSPPRASSVGRRASTLPHEATAGSVAAPYADPYAGYPGGWGPAVDVAAPAGPSVPLAHVPATERPTEFPVAPRYGVYVDPNASNDRTASAPGGFGTPNYAAPYAAPGPAQGEHRDPYGPSPSVPSLPEPAYSQGYPPEHHQARGYPPGSPHLQGPGSQFPQGPVLHGPAPPAQAQAEAQRPLAQEDGDDGLAAYLRRVQLSGLPR